MYRNTKVLSGGPGRPFRITHCKFVLTPSRPRGAARALQGRGRGQARPRGRRVQRGLYYSIWYYMTYSILHYIMAY